MDGAGRTHHRPVDVGRDVLEEFGVVACLHVGEDRCDFFAGWVRSRHDWLRR